MGNELVSAIIPVYNTARYLDKCIESVLTQSYQNIEIILIDDGSTDASGAICDAYQKNDARIKVIHKENEGVILARETGLAAANGEFISFLDSDDWIENDYYEILTKKCHDHPEADIVVGAFVFDEEDGTVKNPFLLSPRKIYTKEEAVYEMIRFKVYGWNLVAKLYRRELFSEEYQWKIMAQEGEDLEYNWHLFNKSRYILFYPYYGYHYVMHPSSNMHMPFTVDKLSVLDRLSFMIEETNNGPLKRELSRRFFDITQNRMFDMFRCHETYKESIDKYQRLLRKYITTVNLNEQEQLMYQFIGQEYDKSKMYYENSITELKERIVGFIKEHRHIFIYGAGKYGKLAADFCIKNNMPFEGMVTTNESSATWYRGYKIMVVDEVFSSYQDYGFILGLGARNAEQVICFLRERALGSDKILDLRNHLDCLNLFSLMGDYYE